MNAPEHFCCPSSNSLWMNFPSLQRPGGVVKVLLKKDLKIYSVQCACFMLESLGLYIRTCLRNHVISKASKPLAEHKKPILNKLRKAIGFLFVRVWDIVGTSGHSYITFQSKSGETCVLRKIICWLRGRWTPSLSFSRPGLIMHQGQQVHVGGMTFASPGRVFSTETHHLQLVSSCCSPGKVNEVFHPDATVTTGLQASVQDVEVFDLP